MNATWCRCFLVESNAAPPLHRPISALPNFMSAKISSLFAILAVVLTVHAAEPNNRPHAPTAEPATATSARSQAVVEPAVGERIVFVGNGLAERDVYFS